MLNSLTVAKHSKFLMRFKTNIEEKKKILEPWIVIWEAIERVYPDDLVKQEKLADGFYRQQLVEDLNQDGVSLALAEDIKLIKSGDDKLFAFITIGYDDKIITPEIMLRLGERVRKFRLWDSCILVHEKHRETGIHHHTHFLVTYTKMKNNNTFAKSKLIQYLSSLEEMSKYTKSQFIDIKGSPDKETKHRSIEEFKKYISGNKTESKLQYCELDAEWRKKNNLDL